MQGTYVENCIVWRNRSLPILLIRGPRCASGIVVDQLHHIITHYVFALDIPPLLQGDNDIPLLQVPLLSQQASTIPSHPPLGPHIPIFRGQLV